MPLRYEAEFLLYLRQSPLCIKPPNLPPAEDWMGPPPEQARTQTKTGGDRLRNNDNPLLDQTNRRTGIDRSRNSANPEDIVFAPPRMAFASARGNKSLENDKGIKEAIEGQGRFGSFRSRNGDTDGDRLREGRTTTGTSRFTRREAGDQESEGWSTVKPRKSFGHDGAERFGGRMGGNFRDDRRQPKDRDDREAPRERSLRTFDSFTRDKDGDDTAENRARNGLSRNKSDVPSWFRNEPPETGTPEKRERIDRAKSWRERDTRDSEPVEDRNSGRNYTGRWGRDREQRVERDPEWLDDPLEEQPETHTQQDFQKWMENMKKQNTGPSSSDKPSIAEATEATEAAEAEIEASKPPVQSAPAIESGPDKFFMAFASNTGLEGAASPGETKETTSKSKASGKSSRFTSFFSQPQEEVRGKTEPPTPMAGLPFGGGMPPLPNMGGNFGAQAPPQEEERQAFQQLLAKLQKQTVSATPPGASPFTAPPQGTPDAGKKSAIASPEPPFPKYGPPDRGMGPMPGPPPQHVQNILSPQPQPQTARPEQLLQDLVGHHQRVTSQGAGRPDSARNNSNTEFLMNLMRAGPDQHRNDPLMMRMPLPQKQPSMPQLNEREPDFPRDNRGPPQRQMRPQPPPGFPMDEPFLNSDMDGRQNLPTQILQRPPPPPGLDQMPPNWMAGGPGGQMPPPPPPPQQRGPMLPPPGLVGVPNRNMPMPHMFPPNFPPGAMPPPEAMGGMPPRNMPPPPPGFFPGPPHGFLPPGLGGYNGPPGPDSMYPGGNPFDARGMPPAGNAGRGPVFPRQ